jgi:aspartate kinase
MSIVVQKFGGTSVASPERIKHVAAHIANTARLGHKVVAVVSAMGDQTDELLKLAHQISPHPPKRELDMLVTSGERIATALVSMAVNNLGLRAVSLTGSQSGIMTDLFHQNARITTINAFRLQNHLDHGDIVVLAGFQGVSQTTKEITTLGRGGTDLSAIAIATYLKADRCEMYKDVDGIYSADPRHVTNAKLYDQITWDELNLMAWSGANVLHPRGAHLAAKYELPIVIRSSFRLEKQGTTVQGALDMMQSIENPSITAITQKKNMTVASLVADSMHRFDEIRLWIWEQGESPQIQNIRIGNSPHQWIMDVSLPTALLSEFKTKLAGIRVTIDKLSENSTISTMIGRGFWQSPELIGRITNLNLEETYREVQNNFILLVTADRLVSPTEMLTRLHQDLIH